MPARRRSARSRKFIQESDGEEGEEEESGKESDRDREARGRLRTRASRKRKEDEEWDEDAEDEDEDADEDEEESWQRDARETLAKLKKNRQCQDIFCEPVSLVWRYHRSSVVRPAEANA